MLTAQEVHIDDQSSICSFTENLPRASVVSGSKCEEDYHFINACPSRGGGSLLRIHLHYPSRSSRLIIDGKMCIDAHLACRAIRLRWSTYTCPPAGAHR